VYLTAEERKQALALSRAVWAVEALAARGERRSTDLIEAARGVMAQEPAAQVDYLEIVDWGALLPVEVAAPGTLFAVAARIGATRLIDNAILA
jgi:pantoate--beta-alanine ligase